MNIDTSPLDLSILAAKDEYAKRLHQEEEHAFRSKFERDRDRILYSRAFRRLSGKTQIFLSSFDDHIRTRLTHTLEVSQIAKTIAKRFNLNEPLVEAMALGHDLGHTPFGHVAERTLNHIMNGCDSIKGFNDGLSEDQKGFKHNWQSIRVVNDLERIDRRFNGLNLTNFTLWGILNHSRTDYKECQYKYGNEGGNCGFDTGRGKPCHFVRTSVHYYDYLSSCLDDASWSLEGVVVNYADEIAQRHHDIEDGLEAGILDHHDLVDKIGIIFNDFLDSGRKKKLNKLKNAREKIEYLPLFSSFIVDLLATHLIEGTCLKISDFLKKYKISSFNMMDLPLRREIYNNSDHLNLVGFNKDFDKAEKKLQDFLSKRILNSYQAQRMDGRSQFIVRRLVKAYLANPQQMPDATIIKIFEKVYKESYLAELKSRHKAKSELVGYLRSRLNEYHKDLEDHDYRAKLLRTVCDFISGMTDDYAMRQYHVLYGQTDF
ncbi:MAG: dNTP triphosphohydrolase [Desulfuromonadales bacterium]|nr:dNTP triphosphohydrolase [Desulfuromonadales bacterium]